ncbi:MAG TPA: winged helix-turn-helix domain-containing tetratricopeptide repeat protein [Steroidobacteraceae bacterium]|nr:winged helix-turn-helix domain-containing tetratricopeptide repeat protein [Steroidobacteraceae bacterium]
MEALSSNEVFLFEGFRLDRCGLFRRDDGAALAPVEIGARALDVLGVLVQRPGELLSRDEIMDAAWPGTVVEDNNLTVQVSTLRRVLDRDRANGSSIQTVPGRGYRFVAPVTRVEPETSPASGTRNRSDEAIAKTGPFDPGAPGTLAPVPLAPISPPWRRFPARIVGSVIGALVLIAILATGIWYLPWSSGARPRLSIAVLPFANLGNDPDHQYFVDGITEDVTTDLSRIVGMFVISRNTAFTYRNKPVDTKQIGRELGVRYVLDGSVQRSGNHVRVTAQLIDAESDAHLWAELFDREMGDLFALQDEITRRVAYTLGRELVGAEAARSTDNPDAMDFILRGHALMFNPPGRENFAKMISELEHAVALDPRSVVAQSYLTTALMGRVLNGMSDLAAADIERAEGLVSQALAVSPRNPLAHFAKGFLLRAQNRIEEAIPEYEVAVASNRNWLLAIATLGWCKFQTGLLEDAIPLHEQAIRLSPRDNLIGVWYQRIGMAHLLKSRTDEAIVWFEKARNANPLHPQPHSWLAAAYALKSDSKRAAAELAEARRLNSDDRYSSIARLKAAPGNFFGVPNIRALYEATYFAGLRKAGMPEE